MRGTDTVRGGNPNPNKAQGTLTRCPPRSKDSKRPEFNAIRPARVQALMLFTLPRAWLVPGSPHTMLCPPSDALPYPIHLALLVLPSTAFPPLTCSARASLSLRWPQRAGLLRRWQLVWIRGGWCWNLGRVQSVPLTSRMNSRARCQWVVVHWRPHGVHWGAVKCRQVSR